MNAFLKLGLIAATALSVFAGCAADADAPASSESDVTSRGRPGPAPAEEGDACGTGFSGIFVDCRDGLECKYPKSAPGAADVMGECIKKGHEGASCGRGNPCVDGLECVGVGAADQPGTCAKKLGGDGDSCGRGLPQCAPTFLCVTAPDDRGGHCEPTAFGE